MTPTTLALFTLASLAVIVTPGPTMLLALSNGAAGGMRLAAFGIAGATLSNLLLIAAVSLGLGALLAASEWLFSFVKWVGVAYLAWLALALWRSPPAAADASAAATGRAPATPQRAFARSLLVALSNPKGLLFFSAFLPQFVDLAAPQAPQYLVLAWVFTAIDALVMSVYAAGGRRAARVLSGAGLRRLNRVCATALLSLAGLLAVYRRSAT